MRAVLPMVFSQTTPSDTWIINHNSNKKPVVSVIVNENGTLEQILPASVAFPTENQVVITFSSPRTGEARLA